MRSDLICWLDLETTGLNPVSDRILEIGMILTDFDLQEVDSFQRVIRVGEEQLRKMDTVVEFMHIRNGLLKEVEAGVSIRDAHADALDWLASHAEKKTAPSGGFSVGFDRSFLAVHANALHDYMSHRMIDCSTLKILRGAWASSVAEPPKGAAHRSIADCREAIAYLKAMRVWLAR